MKETTKEKIYIFGIMFAVTFAVTIIVLGTMFIIFKTQTDKLNVCANAYGEEERKVWQGGLASLNYKYQHFNSTHMACCKKESFIDSNGQIQRLKCKGVYELP